MTTLKNDNSDQSVSMNTIYNMDCIEGMKMIPDWSIDLTVTSPPYDNLRTYNWYSWDFEWIAKELYRITKPWWVVVWVVWDATVKWSETGTSFRQALYFKEIWFNIHDTMIYEKAGCPFPEKNRYYPCFEYMFVFSKGKPKTFNPIKDRKNLYPNSKIARKTHARQIDWSLKENSAMRIDPDRRAGEYGIRFNIWRISNAHWVWWDTFNHPAPFPEKLAEDHILSWSNEWDILLDPFMWSWTTAKMCILNNRKFIWFEISKEYVDIANKRIQDRL